MKNRCLQILLVVNLAAAVSWAANPSIRVQADKPGHPVSPALWGIFFEDINCSADGGLYAELVRNRNFQDAQTPEHWSIVSNDQAVVNMRIETANPTSEKNPRYLRFEVKNTGSGKVGLVNRGFWGINVRRGDTYDLSLWARTPGDFNGPLTISLEGQDKKVYAQDKLTGLSATWKQFRLSLSAESNDPQARLVIAVEKPGTVDIDMVSLFPRKTWKDQPNGLRPDLANLLAEMQPAFMRFPGGCWVEGNTMADAYRWKQTIGPIAERRTQHNIWQYEATHGIGYHEYLQLCEDLGAEALFVVNCGMSHRENVPMDKMGEFVQDALDAIEYARGPASSKWGAVRAANGHPAPFSLKYLEVGNENGGPAYDERYALFYDAVKAKYPDIRIIANLWQGRPKSRPIEILDEHYYSTPDFFIKNANRYDSYDRKGPQIYVGEYAVTQNGGQGNLRAAVGEAAFMVGMERNSDIVVMSSYAPLFANVNYKKWNPDLICFDSSRAYGLPGYYVQKLFSQHRGDRVLPTTVEAEAVDTGPRKGALGVGTWATQAEFKDMKVTRGNEVLFSFDPAQGTKAWRLRGGNWSIQDGALRQNATAENIRAFVGDRSWSDYTYSLKARKIGGAEGFLIPFLVADERAKCWWNIGGWGNSRHAVEMDGIADDSSVDGKIETGRWYDIRVEVSSTRIRCYLDDKLVHDLGYPRIKPIVASGTVKGNEVILKVVNVSTSPQPTDIQIDGARLAASAESILLTSPNAEDENSLDEPMKVSPKTSQVPVEKTAMKQTFPPNSVTILRFRKQ